MIVFDTLDKLEDYVGLRSGLGHVIDVMDRSLPYDEGPGEYMCPEDEKVTYKVDAFLSGKGFELVPKQGMFTLEIILEGECLTSIDSDNVFSMAPGRFLLFSDEHKIKRGMTKNLPVSVKSVVFTY